MDAVILMTPGFFVFSVPSASNSAILVLETVKETSTSLRNN